jgi:hypothetical protein
MAFLGMFALLVVILGLARVLSGLVAEAQENGNNGGGNDAYFFDCS